MTFDNKGITSFFGVIFIYPILFYLTVALFEGIASAVVGWFQGSTRRFK